MFWIRENGYVLDQGNGPQMDMFNKNGLFEGKTFGEKLVYFTFKNKSGSLNVKILRFLEYVPFFYNSVPPPASPQLQKECMWVIKQLKTYWFV